MEDKNKAAEPTIEELKAQLAAEMEKSSASEKIIQEQSEKIADLDAQKSGNYPVATVNKEKYDVVVPSFTHDGKKYTAADVVKDKTLAAELVKGGSGILVKKEA